MYLNGITLIGFLGGDAEKKVSNATNIAVFFARYQNLVEEGRRSVGIADRVASMRRLRQTG